MRLVHEATYKLAVRTKRNLKQLLDDPANQRINIAYRLIFAIESTSHAAACLLVLQ